MQVARHSPHSNIRPRGSLTREPQTCCPSLGRRFSLVLPTDWAFHSAECLVFKDTYFSYNAAPECKPNHYFIWRSTEERAICLEIGANAVCGGHAEYYALQRGASLGMSQGDFWIFVVFALEADLQSQSRRDMRSLYHWFLYRNTQHPICLLLWLQHGQAPCAFIAVSGLCNLDSNCVIRNIHVCIMSNF